jgi:hypothetical protein
MDITNRAMGTAVTWLLTGSLMLLLDHGGEIILTLDDPGIDEDDRDAPVRAWLALNADAIARWQAGEYSSTRQLPTGRFQSCTRFANAF